MWKPRFLGVRGWLVSELLCAVDGGARLEIRARGGGCLAKRDLEAARDAHVDTCFCLSVRPSIIRGAARALDGRDSRACSRTDITLRLDACTANMCGIATSTWRGWCAPGSLHPPLCAHDFSFFRGGSALHSAAMTPTARMTTL